MSVEKAKNLTVVDGEDDSDDSDVPHITNTNQKNFLEEELKQNITTLHQQIFKEATQQQKIISKELSHTLKKSSSKEILGNSIVTLENNKKEFYIKLEKLHILLSENKKKLRFLPYLQGHTKTDDSSLSNVIIPQISAEMFCNSQLLLSNIDESKKQKTKFTPNEYIRNIKKQDIESNFENQNDAYNRWRNIFAKVHASILRQTTRVTKKFILESLEKKKTLDEAQQNIKDTFNISNQLIDTISSFCSVSTDCYPALRRQTVSVMLQRI